MITTEQKQMNTLRTVFMVSMIAASLLPSAALADPTNITTGLTSVETWLLSAAKIIAIIAFIGCGLAKMMGRLQWGYFFSVAAGCAIVFGAAEIAPWFEG